MNKDGKNTILTAIVLVFYLGIFAFAFFYSKSINPILFILIAQVTISFWYFPRLNSRYRSLHTDDTSFKISDFIPVLNELNIVEPWIAIVGMIELAVCAIFIVLIAVPSIMASFGENFVYMADIYLPRIAIALVIAYNVIVGIGLFLVQKDVNEIFEDEFGDVGYNPGGFVGFISTVQKMFPYVMGALFVLPVLKLLPVIFMMDKVDAILRLRGVE